MKKFFMFPVLIISVVSLACNTLLPTKTPSAQEPSVSASPTVNTSPAECSEFNLTPEECANTGSHLYSTSEEVLFDQTGSTCRTGSDDITISFTFLTKDSFLYTNSYEIEVEFTRKDHNVYTGERLQPDGVYRWENTVTFTEDGFIEEANSYEVENNEHLCTFMIEHKIK